MEKQGVPVKIVEGGVEKPGIPVVIVGEDSGGGGKDVYTKDEVNKLLKDLEDKIIKGYYTKDQADKLFATIANTYNKSEVYKKDQTYSKEGIDNRLDGIYKKDETLSKAQIEKVTNGLATEIDTVQKDIELLKEKVVPTAIASVNSQTVIAGADATLSYIKDNFYTNSNDFSIKEDGNAILNSKIEDEGNYIVISGILAIRATSETLDIENRFISITCPNDINGLDSIQVVTLTDNNQGLIPFSFNLKGDISEISIMVKSLGSLEGDFEILSSYVMFSKMK